jgi:hypothetical protein
MRHTRAIVRQVNSRLLFAGVAGAVVIGAVVIVSLSGSGESDIPPAPTECMSAWNDNPVAIQDGVHAYTAHQYGPTEVVYLDRDGRPLPVGETSGDCGVIFGAAELDFEPGFSARIYAERRWGPLAIIREVPIAELEGLQQEALDNANATLLPDGRLVERES